MAERTGGGLLALDVIDVEDLIDLLVHTGAVIEQLAPDPAAEAFNTALAAGSRTLADLAIDLALSAAGLEQALRDQQL
jgi:hypothetical protein